jgi:uncharacterized glyoxalase superfamily protein PhnB/GNAT superfamily N-acetyltransferase
MANDESQDSPQDTSDVRITSLSPILAVPDIAAAIDHYTRVLGFERAWIWGDPPTHGAVRHGRIQIQFGLQPEMAKRAVGMQYFLYVNGIEQFYVQHRANGADIISQLENKPWGLCEYTVRDPTGYQLRFAGEEQFARPPDALHSLPDRIRIVERVPTPDEYIAIIKSVNWSHNPDAIPAAMKGTLYGVVAIDETDPAHPKTVGLLRIVGDGILCFYIQDLAVMPSHQNRHIGAALVETAMKWIRANAPKGAFVGLFTQKPGFYERLDFRIGTGMSQLI